MQKPLDNPHCVFNCLMGHIISWSSTQYYLWWRYSKYNASKNLTSKSMNDRYTNNNKRLKSHGGIIHNPAEILPKHGKFCCMVPQHRTSSAELFLQINHVRSRVEMLHSIPHWIGVKSLWLQLSCWGLSVNQTISCFHRNRRRTVWMNL